MKPTANTFRNLAAGLLLMTVVGLSPLAAAPPIQTAPPKSVFVLPDSPKEGRDPFFPNSIRPYQGRPAPNGSLLELPTLKLQGVSRSRGHIFAIINNVTFGVGDETDVKTPTGKISVRCVQIKTDSAVVVAGGQILTLILSNQ
jgi:hypothetical protein